MGTLRPVRPVFPRGGLSRAGLSRLASRRTWSTDTNPRGRRPLVQADSSKTDRAENKDFEMASLSHLLALAAFLSTGFDAPQPIAVAVPSRDKPVSYAKE